MNWFRRRKSDPAREMLDFLHGFEQSAIVAFERAGYSRDDAIDLAAVAVEGWLDYIRETM